MGNFIFRLLKPSGKTAQVSKSNQVIIVQDSSGVIINEFNEKTFLGRFDEKIENLKVELSKETSKKSLARINEDLKRENKKLYKNIGALENKIELHNENSLLINQLTKLKDEKNLSQQNWEFIIEKINSGGIEIEIEQSVYLFLKGETLEAINSVSEEALVNYYHQLEKQQESALDMMVFKANLHELAGEREKAFYLYEKIVELNPKNKRFYIKAQIHFFYNLNYARFNKSMAISWKNSGLSMAPSQGKGLDDQIDRTIVFNAYNKYKYFLRHYHFIDDSEGQFEILEDLIKSFSKFDSNKKILFFYFDSYRIIRMIYKNIEFLSSQFEEIMKLASNVKYYTELGKKMGYYAYERLANFYQLYYKLPIESNQSLSEYLLGRFDFLTNYEIKNRRSFIYFLSTINICFLLSICSMLRKEFTLAHELFHKASEPLLTAIVENENVSVADRKVLFWEYYYMQLVFLEMGIETKLELKELLILLSHSQLIYQLINEVTVPSNICVSYLKIKARATEIQAKIRIEIYKLTEDDEQLDLAVSCIILSEGGCCREQDYDTDFDSYAQYIEIYLIFKSLELKYPDKMLTIQERHGNYMGEQQKVKAKNYWYDETFPEFHKQRIMERFPNLSFENLEFPNLG